ncbi:TRAP transporter large permease [Chloroflexota bacterium]
MDPLFRDITIYIVILLILIFSGIPIVFALGILATGALFLTFGSGLLPATAYVGWNILASFVIAAIPMFVFMGFLLFETGLSTRVYNGIAPVLDRLLPGGLLHSNIAVGAAFAACSGSTVASCATIGAVALPEMENRGYSRGIAAGSVAAGSTLGTLIPPSVTLIVYGLMAEQSIGKLFIGGIIPGLFLGALYMIYIATRLKLQPSLVSGLKQPQYSWRFCLRALLNIWPVPILVIAVLGSLYTGFATPTEAAAIGCVMVLIIAAGHRLLNWGAMKRTIQGTVVTSSMILMIMFSGKLVGAYLANAGITAGVAARVSALEVSPLVILLGIIIMYLVMGMLMDGITMIIITIPVIVPIMKVLGYDLIWFGLIATLLTECALLTPPVGMNLFILQGLRPDYPFMQIVKGAFPFFLVVLATIFVMIALPQLITFLPELVFG